MGAQLLLLALGFLVIFKGADWFVGAAVSLAEGFHVPKVIIGATIVSLATVSPELFVSLTAAGMSKTGLALGNAIGSPINNIGLIFAVCVCWSFIPVTGRILRREGAMMVASTLVLALVAARFGGVTRPVALGLLAMAAAYLGLAWQAACAARREHQRQHDRQTVPRFNPRQPIGRFLLGVTMVLAGSRLLVFSGTNLARLLGVPESVIGLTLVALGSSLPEFFTTMTALARGHKEISAGNIIGANILDIFLVLGATGLVSPLPFDEQTKQLAIPVLILLTVLFVVFGATRKGFQRWEGGLLLAIFAAYCFLLFRG